MGRLVRASRGGCIACGTLGPPLAPIPTPGALRPSSPPTSTRVLRSRHLHAGGAWRGRRTGERDLHRSRCEKLARHEGRGNPGPASPLHLGHAAESRARAVGGVSPGSPAHASSAPGSPARSDAERWPPARKARPAGTASPTGRLGPTVWLSESSFPPGERRSAYRRPHHPNCLIRLATRSQVRLRPRRPRPSPVHARPAPGTLASEERRRAAGSGRPVAERTAERVTERSVGGPPGGLEEMASGAVPQLRVAQSEGW